LGRCNGRWVILTDGNGVQILLAFQGSGDNTARITMSVGALFVVPATTTNTPTATDDIAYPGSIDVVGVSASADRVWNGWVSSDAKLCRFIVFRQNVIAGSAWSVQRATSVVSGSQVTWSPPVIMFTHDNSNDLGTGTAPGRMRASLQGVGTTVLGRVGCEQLANAFANTNNGFMGIKGPLQDARGYPAILMAIGSDTSPGQGKYADLIDQWAAFATSIATLYGTSANQFIALTQCGGSTVRLLWPWDGSTVPQTT
jgi:hypothetical protein